MNFKEDSFMVAIALCVVFFVVAQALFFLVRAVKRAKELGIANQTIKNTIVSSSLFTIAPAIGIVATVLTLSAGLGYVLLSVLRAEYPNRLKTKKFLQRLRGL